MSRVLILEDEQDIREFVAINLKRVGYEVLEAGTGEKALELLEREQADFAILDVMLPGIDGFQVCKEIRKVNQEMGIIMLTARGQEMDKVNGLYLGADDYVVKPFSPMELVARVDALARRVVAKQPVKKEELRLGSFTLDLQGRRLLKAGKEIELTEIELAIITLFIEAPGKAFSREEILNQVWGEDYVGSGKVVDVNIRRIRQKIERDASNPEFIETVWGYGYKWRGEE